MKRILFFPGMFIIVFISLVPWYFVAAITPSDLQQKGNANPDRKFEYPVKISKNQRYFTDANGQPFFYQACTGWMLLSKLTREETDVYLKNRSQKGFNTIQVTLLPWEPDDVNRYGEPAFLGKKYFTLPNEKYFEHVEWVLNKAREYGIQLCMNVFWLRNNWREYTTADNAQIFGTYVSNRFLHLNNIMWFIGGDINPLAKTDAQTALAETIHAVDKKHLLSSHCGRYSDGTSTSSSMLYHRESWHDYNMAYCYDPSHSPRFDPYAHVQFIHAYNLKPVKPIILGEGFYEEINYTFKDSIEQFFAVRRNPLWGLTSGITGHAVGHAKIYPFGDGWQKALDDPNSLMVKHLAKLTNEIKWWTLVPDQNKEVGINGYGNFGGEHYISLAYDPKGKLAVAYFPYQGKLTVDMSKFSGSVKGRWFDPVNGNEIPITSELPNKGTYDFSPPGNNRAGTPDFMLILESD
jgi:Protein of unknown function (DUF4038)/Putative collagen-binding domain of a collagenase